MAKVAVYADGDAAFERIADLLFPNGDTGDTSPNEDIFEDPRLHPFRMHKAGWVFAFDFNPTDPEQMPYVYTSKPVTSDEGTEWPYTPVGHGMTERWLVTEMVRYDGDGSDL